MEIPVTKEILQFMSLENMKVVLEQLLYKISGPSKKVYLLTDPSNEKQVVQYTKEVYDNFLNDSVMSDDKDGDLIANNKMIDLISGISRYHEALKYERLIKLSADISK